jgi:hypothetical protein
MRLHLVVARNALDLTEIKFFVSNAPPETSVQSLLLVAFSRWRIEPALRWLSTMFPPVGTCLLRWFGTTFLPAGT